MSAQNAIYHLRLPWLVRAALVALNDHVTALFSAGLICDPLQTRLGCSEGVEGRVEEAQAHCPCCSLIAVGCCVIRLTKLGPRCTQAMQVGRVFFAFRMRIVRCVCAGRCCTRGHAVWAGWSGHVLHVSGGGVVSDVVKGHGSWLCAGREVALVRDCKDHLRPTI